eukprot:SAG31_NODE_8311_length_1476_cov_1.790123_2_plen_99_part_00
MTGRPIGKILLEPWLPLANLRVSRTACDENITPPCIVKVTWALAANNDSFVSVVEREKATDRFTLGKATMILAALDFAKIGGSSTTVLFVTGASAYKL